MLYLALIPVVFGLVGHPHPSSGTPRVLSQRIQGNFFGREIASRPKFKRNARADWHEEWGHHWIADHQMQISNAAQDLSGAASSALTKASAAAEHVSGTWREAVTAIKSAIQTCLEAAEKGPVFSLAGGLVEGVGRGVRGVGRGLRALGEGVQQCLPSTVEGRVIMATWVGFIFLIRLLIVRSRRATRLSDLEVSQGILVPPFSPDITEYTLEVPDGAQSAEFFPVPWLSTAEVTIAGGKRRGTGKDYDIRVRAPRANMFAEQERQYNVHIRRAKRLVFECGAFSRPKIKQKLGQGGYYTGEDAFFLASARQQRAVSTSDKAVKYDKWPYLSAKLDSVTSMGIADGVGGWREVGIDPGEFSRQLMYVTGQALLINTGSGGEEKLGEMLQPVEALQFAATSAETPGTATATVISLDGGCKLTASNLGDSGYIVIREGKIVSASEPQLHQFNMPFQLGNPEIEVDSNQAIDSDIYDFRVKPGDIVVVASDGLFDNLGYTEITDMATETAESGKSPTSIAQRLVDRAFSVSFDQNALTPWAEGVDKERLGWKSKLTLGPKQRGGKRDDITVCVGIVRESFAK
ncbi:hypothetical protein AAMO2058_000839500 [Amorphochlora amoebiformis]